MDYSVWEARSWPWNEASSATGYSGLAPEAWWLATTSRWRTTMALHHSPTKPVLCSRIREHSEDPKGGFRVRSPERARSASRFESRSSSRLLQFHLGAGVFQLLLGGLGVGLGNAFLDGLRSAVDQVLGFLQAQAGDFAHGLDDGHLVGAGFQQLHGELGLLFDGRSGSTATAGGRSGH